jgi:K+-sensing histidine kinase KdpD
MSKPEKKLSQLAISNENQPASELKAHKDDILNTWKNRLRNEIPAAQRQREPALLNSVPLFLDRLIEALAYSHKEREKALQASLTAVDHGEQRPELPPYSLDQVLLEHRILREVIFDVLTASGMLTDSAMDTIADSIQAGMSVAASEFLRIRMIREMQAHRNAETANQRLKGLQEVTEATLANTTSMQELLYELLARVRHVFQSDTVVIALADEKNKALAICAANGLEEEVKTGMTIPYGRGIAGKVYNEKRGMIFNDLSKVEIYSPILKKKSLHSLMAIPLRTLRDILGVIHVGTLAHRKFSEDELTLLQLIGDRIALAIENARLYDERKIEIASLLSEKNVRQKFITMLTHDIRNPISAAQMSATLLLRHGELPEIGRRLCQRIVDALARSDQLIQDLLDINKILSKEPLSLEHEDLDFFDILSRVMSQLYFAHGDRFILHSERPIPGKFSQRELSRLLEIALSMGIRYGDPETPILISVSTTNLNIIIEIRFNGEISQPRSLFALLSENNAWAQAQRQSRQSLEWALLNGFVNAHQGNIQFQSSKSSGTEIKIALPRTPLLT